MDVSVGYPIYEPSLPPIPSEGNTMSGTSRIMTIHFGFPMPDNVQETEIIRWCDPISGEDGRRGRVCSASGMWFPGRMLVEVNGKIYGLPFAPQLQRGAVVPEEWGIPDDPDGLIE